MLLTAVMFHIIIMHKTIEIEKHIVHHIIHNNTNILNSR